MEVNINRLKSIPTYMALLKKFTGRTISRQQVYAKIRSNNLPSVTIEGKIFVVVDSEWV